MSVCPELSSYAGIFRYLLETISELAYQCRPSAGEFAPSGQEMSLWLSRQSRDWQKRHTSSSSKQTSDEALCRLLEFLVLSMHSSSLPLLLVLLVYHKLTSLFIPQTPFFSHCTTTVRFMPGWMVQ
jgi:hypothetical protein